tara:strand:- start:542 stop:805 length:264 start_codon:yes stop_codon:yes gene_type:complete
MEPVWIAFSCGIFLGTCVGVLGLGLLQLSRDNKLMIDLQDANDRIQELTSIRQILKEEIFRLSKNYKPRKPQPRKRRNHKKKYTKNI